MRHAAVSQNLPSSGDVLITTTIGNHLLSVVPHPHRLSFEDLTHALEVAAQWAKANGSGVWRVVDGEIVRVSPRVRRVAFHRAVTRT